VLGVRSGWIADLRQSLDDRDPEVSPGGEFNRSGYSGGGSCAGVDKGTRRRVNSANFNRNVNVGGGGFYGRLLWRGCGGVAARVVASAVGRRAAAASMPAAYEVRFLSWRSVKYGGFSGARVVRG
jgi:hypothetical protein